MTSLLIKSKRWLMEPHVWRFVGFASTIVGVSSYVLSSSFKHLFGQWNLLKIFLYSVLSVTISLAVLFAKVWKYSSNLRLKAHVLFLVLTITSVYSFFYDKAVNKKTDAYGLTSCAAFAFMSLSLSRQAHCGFEVELLYFFLGALIVQLMKVKLWFGIIGVGFSYSLIILRSSLKSLSENIGPVGVLQDQHHLVIQVDPQSPIPNNSVLIMEGFKRAMKELQQADRRLVHAIRDGLNDYLTGKDDHIPLALASDHNFLVDELPSGTIRELQENVKLMMDGGRIFEKEYSDRYISWRQKFLEMCLSFLKIEELGIMDIYKEEKMKKWTKASNVVFRILLPNERRLCNHVFLGFFSLAGLSFTQLCDEVMNSMLCFARDFITWMRWRNHFPRNLQIFETLHGLILEFESLFSDGYSASLRTKTITVTRAIGKAIRDYYSVELEHLILLDTEQKYVPGGIYPITYQVMNRVSGVFKARDTLELVFQDDPIVAVREGASWSLSVHVEWIIELLENHLEAKSKTYPNHALRHVFLTNNCRYIGQKAQYTQLDSILGDDWIQLQTAKVLQHVEHYQRSSWDSNDKLNVTAESIKEKLYSFNTH